MTRPQTSATAVEIARFQALEELVELNISIWVSLGEAAYRREPAVAALHCRQIALATREAFALVRALTAPATPDAAE